MADRISARRTQANAFFIGVESALVALLGNQSFDQDAIAAAGIVLAVVWWLLLRSYRDLNRAKFDVILTMEERLPAQIFSAEWERLKVDPVRSWRKRYAELGAVERFVPVVCVIGYLSVLLAHAL
jgi:hypothetical protein